MLTALNMILDPQGVNEYLTHHGLEDGNVPIEAVLLQEHGTVEEQPAVMLVVNVDGKRVVAKTTLRLLTAAVASMNARAGG